MINFIICDDNNKIVDDIKNIISKYMMKNEHNYKTHLFNDYDSNFMKVVNSNLQCKIYILDIETPTRSGIDVARIIREKDVDSMIIFITGHDAIARNLPAASGWAEEAEELTLRIHELSRSVVDATSDIDADGASLEELDRRLSVVNRLKRKYGGDVGEIMSKLEAKRERLGELERRDETLARLRAEIAEAEAEVRSVGKELTRSRKTAAGKLAGSVTSELRDLGFLQAGFAVSFSPAEPEAHGCDRIAYMFEPNPGESARHLADVASSGEIARVMLAVKGVLARHDSVGLLVFDEIDANIGGEAGRVVGAKMKALSERSQVVAITHLPQSAVYGDRHLVVAKSVKGGRTRTEISEVEGEARVSEIARMLGGEKLTSVVRKHANELLQISR